MVTVFEIAGGHSVLIDDADVRMVSGFKWYRTTGNPSYAEMRVKRDGIKYCLSMHRLLLNPPHGFECDHINRDGLDNRRANLRIATASQNSANRRSNRSQYRGVYKRGRCFGFEAKIMKRPNLYYLGKFESAIEAAKAYDAAALELFGEFAQLNFPAKVSA